MSDPVTTTILGFERQHELLQQAERDRLIRRIRLARNRRQGLGLKIPAIIGRLFTARPSNRPADESQPAPEHTPTAA